ncbi:MAG: hypothetical protein GVY19_06640 [Bacteroidetes bacterium]|jgi:hypothetical protein|nr:hypothetical protein [Bacteroidota bacterium]
MLYIAYGLKIESEIDLPLNADTTDTRNPDIRIARHKVPAELQPVINKGMLFEANNREFLMSVPQTGSIYVKNGNEVWVEDEPGQLNILVIYLLGSALGALFHQRGRLSLHASCVTNREQTLLIAGMSGSGKSTISGALLKQGFNFICDDIAVLREENGQFMVEAGAPYIKLWQDTLEKLEIDSTKLSRIREGLEKFYFTPPANNPQSWPVSHIVALQTQNKPDPEITELSGMQKFNRMKNNLFRPHFLKDTENHPEIFQAYNRFLSQTRVFELKRPSSHQIHPKLISMLLHALQ